MNRRAFLAAGSLALGAGCSRLTGDSKTDPPEPPAACAVDPDVTPGTPGWPSETGGAKNTRSVPTADVPAPPLELDWTFTTGGYVAAPRPVAADGTVYATDFDDDVHAVDAATGEHRWRVTGAVNSSVAVAGNRLFVVGDDSLRALDVGTGEEAWTTESAVETSILSGGLQATEETVFVSGGLFLSAFDVETGERRWRFSTGLRTESGPAIADGTVFVGSDDTSVYALDAATGERRWRYKTDGRVSCDTAAADGVVYAASGDGILYALDAKTGKKRWKRSAGNVETLAVDGGRVYAAGGRADSSAVHAFTAESGTACWSSDEYESVHAGGLAASSNGLYLPTGFFSGGDVLGVLNPLTGGRRWRDTNSGFGVDSGLAVADGAVYVGGRDDDNELAVARFVPKT